ncbi:hypothetical protein BCR34DRAFT_588787 [Clohesyomyces aquaticus]|uniref:N-acetyltransferase domain-containing protein n=1 Tax=Clohesyomyces aquaticus TaxID=1231657 RepID=A0A1Y1ZIV7_9PLEO|nr:hypothetical protein BCR34DRAFT_588787 [Clohesyomyces aquaticus]
MASSHLSISLLAPEEAGIYVAIRHETFRPTINKLLYSREPSESTLNDVTEHYRKDITEGNAIHLKVTDNKTGETIACARWRYVLSKVEGNERANGAAAIALGSNADSEAVNAIKKPRERTWEEVDAGLTTPPPYAESDPRIWNALFEMLNSNKREILQTRPYYVLDTCVTHPAHHRRGAGGMLVQWGCDQADANGVECYLEASPMGAPLYKRYGFRRVKEIELDVREFGGEIFSFSLMVRPAKEIL